MKGQGQKRPGSVRMLPQYPAKTAGWLGLVRFSFDGRAGGWDVG